MSNTRSEPLIEFVHGKETASQKIYSKKNKQSNRKAGLSGDDVRTLYEGIISGDTQLTNESVKPFKTTESSETFEVSERSENSEKFSKSSRSTHNKRSYSKSEYCAKSEQNRIQERSKAELCLLQSSQDGNIDGVVACIRDGIDINVQDQYGWTPLMCSAYAGHNRVVTILLESGADWTICEKRGRTAGDLAKHSGNHGAVKLIENKDVSCPDMTEESIGSEKQDDGFYCDVCKKRFIEGSFRSHSSSTVHLFNRQLKPPEPSYLIAESNVGYQMMLRSGWDNSQGLGPRGEGHKYPVKTVLKRDREGLGRERVSSPRVTHFKPGDVKAVKSVKPRGERRESMRTVSRRAMRKRERKDREWEIKLRQYMNSE